MNHPHRIGKWLLAFSVVFMGLFLTRTVHSLTMEEQMAMYETFVAAKDRFRYNIRTDVQTSTASYYTYPDEIYLFHQDYSFASSRASYLHPLLRTQDRLVVYGDETASYKRIRSYSNHTSDRFEAVPYFRYDDPAILLEMETFLDHPVFSLDMTGRSFFSNIPIDVATLGPEETVWMEASIRTHFPDFVMPASGIFRITVIFRYGKVNEISVDCKELIPGAIAFVQTIKVDGLTTLDLPTLLADAIDVRHLSTLESTTLETASPENTVDFRYVERDGKAQIVFLEIKTAGEYVFTLTDDSWQDDPLWMLFDLEMRSRILLLELPEWDNHFKSPRVSAQLEEGIYYLYLKPRPSTIGTASLTFALRTETDDFPDVAGYGQAAITEDTTLAFRTEVPYDYDVLSLASDADYAVIRHDGTLGAALYRSSGAVLTRLYDTWLVKMPPSGQVFLTISGIEVQNHEIRIEFMSSNPEAIPFDQAAEINLALLSNIAATYGTLALPFDGGVARYKIELTASSQLYVTSTSSSYALFSADLQPQSASAPGMYTVGAGTYYVELSHFTAPYTMVRLVPELLSGDFMEVTPIDGKLTISGKIDSYEDVDVFRFRVETDSLIRFDCLPPIVVMVYGVDNPRIYLWDIRNAIPFFLPAGTYHLTLPYQLLFSTGYLYQFNASIQPFVEEEETILSPTEVTQDNGIDTHVFHPSFDYFGDKETISFSVEAGSKVNFTFPAWIDKATITIVSDSGTTTAQGYIYNTEQNNQFLTLGTAATITVVFEVNASETRFVTTSGDIPIEVHVWK